MPTKLPQHRRRSTPEPEGDSDAGDTLVPVLIICTLLFANIALYCDKFYPPLPDYAVAAAPVDLQLSP